MNKKRIVNFIKDNNIYIILCMLIIISFIPIIRIGEFNHPSSDDFAYSLATHQTWLSTHSLIEVIKVAFNTTIEFWHKWQGLYSSSFVLALQPGIFGENYYSITSLVMLLLIVISNVVFFIYVIKKFEGKIFGGVVIGLLSSYMCIQFIVNPSEGLFWFNGAINYGLFWSILVIFSCLFIELQMCSRKLPLFLLCLVLSFLIEGGNHVSALMCPVSIIFVIVYRFIKEKKVNIYNLVLLVSTIVFLYINLSSPGTKIRAGYFDTTISLWTILNTIYRAICEGVLTICKWFNLRMILSYIIIFPICLKVVKRVDYKFDKPIIFVILSVGYICAMYCPCLLASNMTGAPRLINIIYYSFVIWFYLDLTYIVGYLYNKKEIELKNSKYLYIVVISLFCFIFICSVDTTWYKANQELQSGQAITYSNEIWDRCELYKKSQGKDVSVSPLKNYSGLLFYEDISEVRQDNKTYASYYGINSVALDWSLYY